MACRRSHLLNARRRASALMAALAVIGWLAAPAASASAATPLTGEALTGTGTTTNAHGSCPRYVSGSGSFSVSGTATGPYPGVFAESGTFSIWGDTNQPYAVTFSATFTVTSGSTTITGSLKFPSYRDWLVGFTCSTSGALAYTLTNLPVNYTAVINGQTYQGTATATGTFDTVLATQPLDSVRDGFTG